MGRKAAEGQIVPVCSSSDQTADVVGRSFACLSKLLDSCGMVRIQRRVPKLIWTQKKRKFVKDPTSTPDAPECLRRYHMKTLRNLLTTVVFLALFPSVAHSQTSVTSRFWINIWEDGPWGDTNALEFGNDVRATYGVDDGTNGTYDLGEYICPPSPPGPLEVSWKNIPGRKYQEMGCLRDFRSLPTDSARRDTFKIFFFQGNSPDSSVYFSWPDSSYLRARCDSMFMVFHDSSFGPRKIDMLNQQTFTIPAANSRGINYAFIYKFGVQIIDGVRDDKIDLPIGFALEQSFPNPFNSSTLIKYSLPIEGRVRLSVYNMLGQELATLVNETQSAGHKSVSFNASNLSSGIYTYRLTAGGFSNMKKMMLIK